MRHFVIASVVTGSSLLAASASAQQQQPGYTPGTPPPTYTPAPVQPAPSPQPQYGQAPPAAQPPPQQQQPQYGQTGAQPQPQYAPAQAQPQYAPQQQPQPQPQYGGQQPQYAPQQQSQYGQQQPQPGYGGSASFSSSPAPEMAPVVGGAGAWRPSNAKFIIAGERLFGVSVLGGTLSFPDGTSGTGSATMVNLLWSNSSVNVANVAAVNPYTMPMLTFHGVVAGGLTIGGGIGYASTTGSSEFGGVSTDSPTRSAVAVSPRIGYLASFSPTFGIWAKGGITYFSEKEEGTTLDCSNPTFGCTSSSYEMGISGVAIAIDPMLVLAPVPHVGILIGPTLDIGVSGTLTQSGSDQDLTLRNFGAQAGLALLF